MRVDKYARSEGFIVIREVFVIIRKIYGKVHQKRSGKMVVFILAMAFQAVCATQELMPVEKCNVSLSGDFVLQWSQPFETLFAKERDITVRLGGGRSCVVNSFDGRELVRIRQDVDSGTEYRLGCYIPHLCRGVNGDIFSLFIDCVGKPGVYGSVGYQNEDPSTGCLVVKRPYEDVITKRFSVEGYAPMQTFCEYDFQREHLSVTRFLVKYDDQSQVFVRMQIPYASVQKVLVTWGNVLDGFETPQEQPLLLDFTHRERP